MNFLDGTLRAGSAERLEFVEGAGGNGVAIPLSGEASERVKGHVGKPVVLGMRPQALLDGAVGSGPSLTMPVMLIEPLGDSMDIFLQTPAGGTLVARVRSREGVARGQSLTLAVETAALAIFEPGETGRNLTI